MRITLATLLAFILLQLPLLAQKQSKSKEDAQTMLGINITNTLAGFFNSGGQDILKDPFLFSLKTLKDNKVWRIGANAKVDQKEEDSFNGLLKTTETSVKLRLGREWVMPLHKRFDMYYGLDAVGTYDLDRSKFQFGDSLISRDQQFGIGAGPLLGVYFKLGEHVRFSTETYAYVMYYYGESLDQIGGGVSDQTKRTSRLSFLPAMPNSLYIHFTF
ncbi:MAG: hypothetical protein IPN76_11250 [Saprospiraceae bacterium]|nr:hypothetical protein [Saprospiraceae bacterium]